MPPPTPPRNLDTISLTSLSTTATLSPTPWPRPPRPQPLLLSLFLTLDTAPAATTDTLTHTFSYGTMAKAVRAATDNGTFASIDELTARIARLADEWPGERLRIEAVAPGGLLRVGGGWGREVVMRRGGEEGKGEGWWRESHGWFVRGLGVACVVGVNAWERGEKQGVVVGLAMGGEEGEGAYAAQIAEGGEMWRRLVRRVCEVVEPSTFQTLEALAALIARTCLEEFPFPEITVTVAKPSAIAFAAAAAVEITRHRSWLLSPGDGNIPP